MSKRCKICGLNKKSNQFFKSKAARYYGICIPCFKKKEEKAEFFDPQQHRKEWYETYGKPDPISKNKSDVEYARFIPRSKNTRL